MVKGELIIANTDRIMTRSRAKLSELPSIDHMINNSHHRPDPDQYTIIPAPLKILKVLIEELVSASGMQAASNIAAAAATEFADADADDDDGDNEGWEDEADDTLDLALGGTKSDLMGWLEAGGGSSRQRDDETQAYLVDFFIRADAENIAEFQNWCGMLTDDEKHKVKEAAQ